jgi:hypothetical protein
MKYSEVPVTDRRMSIPDLNTTRVVLVGVIASSSPLVPPRNVVLNLDNGRYVTNSLKIHGSRQQFSDTILSAAAARTQVFLDTVVAKNAKAIVP